MEGNVERLSRLEERVTALETRTAVNESDIRTLKEKLDKIDNNTTWVLRLIIGAVITGILKLSGVF